MYSRHDREAARVRRHRRVRQHLEGTATRPRLCVHRSLRHISVQVIDDGSGRTVAAASTLEPAVAERISGSRATAQAAAVVGETVASRLIEKGMSRVVFDRGGYLYHGRVAALAEAARKAGLEF
ncbi:MAG TPA: 50S ribosomal protein L18 [Candidatus Binatia bacterium]|nr:50S ribosomal protein L18 [Candidatus Binatia bacterium]